jgi:hypothetical protein
VQANNDLYKEYRRYSPFYLRNHPEERKSGDIVDIQGMAQQGDFEDIRGVENVFEKNINNFEHLMKGTSKSSSTNTLQDLDS